VNVLDSRFYTRLIVEISDGKKKSQKSHWMK